MQNKPACRFLIAALLAGSSFSQIARGQDAAAAPDGEPEPEPDMPAVPDDGGEPQPLEPQPLGPVAPVPSSIPDELYDDSDYGAPGEPAVGEVSSPRSLRNAKSIRLEEAIELALRRHPQLIAARQRIESADTRVGQAQAAYYPQIDGWMQYLRATENGALTAFMGGMPGFTRVGGSSREGVEWHHSFNNFLVGVIARQMIYDFGRTKGAVGAQKASVKVAEMTEKLVEQIVIVGVMQAFYEVRAARETVRVAEEALKNSTGIFELAQAGYDAGLRPPSEKARAEADVAAAEVGLIRANLELDMARARVANAMGVAGQAFEPADRALSPPAPVASVEENIEVALRQRPELRALDFRRDALTQTLRSVKGEQYPRIQGLVGANTRGQFAVQHPSGNDSYQVFNWNVGVVVNIPMFQGFLIRKQKQELHAEMRALDGDQEAVVQAVILEVQQAMATVRAADEAAKATQKGVEAADIALETSRGRYRAGLANLIELIDAQAAYVEARSQAVRATYDRHLARAILNFATGQAARSSSAPTRTRAPAQ
jgi:outer membrane protein